VEIINCCQFEFCPLVPNWMQVCTVYLLSHILPFASLFYVFRGAFGTDHIGEGFTKLSRPAFSPSSKFHFNSQVKSYMRSFERCSSAKLICPFTLLLDLASTRFSWSSQGTSSHLCKELKYLILKPHDTFNFSALKVRRVQLEQVQSRCNSSNTIKYQDLVCLFEQLLHSTAHTTKSKNKKLRN